jgi:urease accessory protein
MSPRLLHLVDSALPTGAFAYSYGLESSLTLGLIADETELRHYLYAYLQQAAGLEIPFVNSCFQLDLSDEAERRLMVLEYDAMLLIPALHRASTAQGRSWLKLLISFYPSPELLALHDWFADPRCPPHFTLVFALGLRQAGLTLTDVQTMLLHSLLRDQVSAAIRLGFLGPLAGHRLQHDFYAVFEHLLAGEAGRLYPDATRSAFLLDTAQMLHADLYSRLFQN